MDVGYLNDRPFLGTAGIGFDARVAHQFDRSAKRGFGKYFQIIVKEVFGAAPMRVKLQAAGQELEEDVLMVVFANTREFGNGARIAPAARPDDGLADLKVVRKPGTLGLFRAFLDLYTGNADRSSYIRTLITDRATVWQEGTLAHLDGEGQGPAGGALRNEAWARRRGAQAARAWLDRGYSVSPPWARWETELV